MSSSFQARFFLFYIITTFNLELHKLALDRTQASALFSISWRSSISMTIITYNNFGYLYRTNCLLFIISYLNILNRLIFKPRLRIHWSVQSSLFVAFEVSETSRVNFNMKQVLGSQINFRFLNRIMLPIHTTKFGKGHFLKIESNELCIILYFYKYCVDLVGMGFYILFFQQFYKLKKQNIFSEEIVQVKPKKLVLQEIQAIDSISRNSSVDDSKSKEINISKELIYCSKIDAVVSQSWTQDDVKETQNAKRDFKK
ncbi:Hypothetical_protein [Hexamita inflata]|uniref:Hypothetical_protein n=1 Tax=Hexamita inflata TaxID=28002 RepID=A0AA86UYX0_9EUKA|nr:Hypothetical protein HINF_LOCUS65220 [Hexamita inflata]